MIRWRLRVIMAEKNLNNKKLAEISGVHATTISRLKNVDKVKQISSEILNALCMALQCTPNDLLEFTPDLPHISEEFSETQKNESVVKLKQSNSDQQYKDTNFSQTKKIFKTEKISQTEKINVENVSPQNSLAEIT